MNSLEIKNIRKQLRLNQTKFGQMLGVSMRAVQSWESGERNMPESTALLLNQIIEEQSVHNTTHKATHKATHKPEGKIINKDEYPKKNVLVIPIKGRGGLENAMFDEIKFKDLNTEELTIKEPSSNGSKWFKIEVEGISMDDGSKKSLSEGDWAYCRSIGKQYWKDKFHNHKYDIFCFFHNERGIIFKKIKSQDLETGELVLTSLHEDKKRFPDFKIKVSECSYICNVIKVLSEF